MNTPPPAPPSLAGQDVPRTGPEPVGRIFALAIGLTLLSDFLLWSVRPGLSWGLFLLAVGGALGLNRPCAVRNRTVAVLLGLLLATAIQSAVELSFTNVVVGLALVVGLVGETAYPTLRSGWERCSEALWALVKSPGRWAWASTALARLAENTSGGLSWVTQVIRIGLPAVILGLIFAGILGAGNAIFGSWISHACEVVIHWLAEFDLSLGHLLFYGFLGTLALWALRPSDPASSLRLWVKVIPRIPVLNPSIAWWRSVAILAVLNALFFTVNTIDALYLWIHTQLPPGMTNTQFVHEGVNSLIAATLLSAVVLSTLFQQGGGVSESLALKRLGCLWIAQNFVLIAGVALRLMRYIQMSQLTPPRIYALCFVLLVAVGFVLLMIHIVRNRTLNWLILSNGLATLTLFFILQFLNVDGWVAEFNVRHWERNPKWALDMEYLKKLDAPAWPALQRVADTRKPEAAEANRWLKQAREREQNAVRNWRSWQARRAWNAEWLLGKR